jgi:hypothetical protein
MKAGYDDCDASDLMRERVDRKPKLFSSRAIRLLKVSKLKQGTQS